MEYTYVGYATINSKTTSIRKYENGFYAVEVSRDLKYSSDSLEGLEEKMKEDTVSYKITNRS